MALPVHDFEREDAWNAEVSFDLDNDEEELTPTQEEAEADFAEYLLDLRCKGRVSSKTVCMIAWFATRAGVGGRVKDLRLGLKTKSGHLRSTGHFQRKLDRAVGETRDLKDRYELEIPGHDKHELSRTTLTLPCFPPHESLARELEEDPALRSRMEQSLLDEAWPPVYSQHPQVAAAAPGEVVYPLALYMDGVPFQRRESVLAFYIVNLLSPKRHLCVVIRKSQMCRCGCRGWCSLDPIMRFLKWSISAFAGVLPRERHDGTAFTTRADAQRRSVAGGRCIEGAFLYCKADWAEFAHTLGLPNWSSLEHPCFACSVERDQLGMLGEMSAEGPPFSAKTQRHYDEACEMCEFHVTITRRQHAVIMGLLEYDKRPHGNHGRALAAPGMPELGLLPGDRLEPTADLVDVASFDKLQNFPVTVLFWRHNNETMTLHRNPLFEALPFDYLAVDVLHTLHLGVYKAFCASTLWFLLDCNPWGLHNVGGCQELALNRLTMELQAWYGAARAAGEEVYEIGVLTVDMLGKRAKNTIATKGAETGSLLGFCRDILRRPGLAPRARPLLALGDALVDLQTACRTFPRVLGNVHRQRLVDIAKLAMNLREAAEVPLTPKWHLMLHLVQRAGWFGNPMLYATFEDEGYNGKLASLAKSFHTLTWHRRVLRAFQRAYTRPTN